MDQLSRIESKLDALLKKSSVKWEEPAPPAPPELTQAQKDAIANAPVVKVPGPPEGPANTEAAQQEAIANAPVVAVPGPDEPAAADK